MIKQKKIPRDMCMFLVHAYAYVRHVGMYVCMHVCMYVRMYVCVYIYVCVFAYVYVYVHVQTALGPPAAILAERFLAPGRHFVRFCVPSHG